MDAGEWESLCDGCGLCCQIRVEDEDTGAIALSDAACRYLDLATHRCADNGAKVDSSDCSHSTDVGDDELKAWWTDPNFDPDRQAFYYVRVLEVKTPRWTADDAKRFGSAIAPGTRMEHQERAYTSPIWYTPPR